MENKKLAEINIVENLLNSAKKTTKEDKGFFLIELDLYKKYYPDLEVFLDSIARELHNKYDLKI